MINVEAHATHWRMAKQDSVRIVTASMYQSARCAFGMFATQQSAAVKKKKNGGNLTVQNDGCSNGHGVIGGINRYITGFISLVVNAFAFWAV